MRAWRVHEYGPEPGTAMQLDRVPLPEPGAGEVLVRVQAIPLNLNEGPLYEYACHEGNDGLSGILLVNRRIERTEAGR